MNQNVEQQIFKLQQDMEVLKISHEADISANNMQIQELKEAMVKYAPTKEKLADIFTKPL